MTQEQTLTERAIGEEGRDTGGDISLICDKSVATQHLAFFELLGMERNVCRCNLNSYSAITQLAKLAAGEQVCRLCTHEKL